MRSLAEMWCEKDVPTRRMSCVSGQKGQEGEPKRKVFGSGGSGMDLHSACCKLGTRSWLWGAKLHFIQCFQQENAGVVALGLFPTHPLFIASQPCL